MRSKSEKKVIFILLTNFHTHYLVANENSLKEIFLRKPQYWEKIFKQHLEQEVQPNFSIYRKPFEPEQDPSKSDLCKFAFLFILNSSAYTLYEKLRESTVPEL